VTAVLSRALLVLFGIALSLGLLELWFRVRYPSPSPRLANAGLQIDERYGLSFIPSSQGWNTSLRGEYSTYITVNSKGLRDVDRGYHKPHGVTRVLVLCDSMTAAVRVPLKDTTSSTYGLSMSCVDWRSTQGGPSTTGTRATTCPRHID
jgi:hypothetical protein